MKFLSVLGLTFLISLGAFQSRADAQRRPDNVVDFLLRSGGEFDNNPFDYDILINAVLAADSQGAGLLDALSDPNGNFTVFAPNDIAFIRTARDLGYEGRNEAEAFDFLVAAFTEIGEGNPFPVLTNVLLYHVAPRQISAFGLFKLTLRRRQIKTLLTVEGQSVKIRPRFLRLIDQDPDIRDPRVTIPFEVRTKNGRVHTINRVLIPVNL